MIDPVSSIAAPIAAAADRPPAPPQPQAQAPGQAGDTPAQAPAAPAPLALDVARSVEGVFVYTLSDPGTGAVVAIIPRLDMRLDRDGRHLDQRV